jgi:hypothetical protein
MPHRKSKPMPLESRTFETFLMLAVGTAIREAIHQWLVMQEHRYQHGQMSLPIRIREKRQAMREMSKSRKRNPVAWKRAESKPAPRHP